MTLQNKGHPTQDHTNFKFSGTNDMSDIVQIVGEMGAFIQFESCSDSEDVSKALVYVINELFYVVNVGDHVVHINKTGLALEFWEDNSDRTLKF